MIKYKIVESRIIDQNQWVKVIKDEITIEGRKDNVDFLWLDEKDFVVVFGTTTDGKVLMIDQFRYPIEESFIEFPSGSIENDEEPLSAALRELMEETGYHSQELIFQKNIYLDMARSKKIGHVYFARGLERVSSQKLDENEEISIRLVTFEMLQNLIDNNDIKCVKTLAVALLALQKKDWFMGV